MATTTSTTRQQNPGEEQEQQQENLLLAADDLPSVFPDLEPIPQEDDDDSNGICRINYKHDFVVAYNYFRAVLRVDERTQRAIQLTALCLRYNPANYTVWHYRRRCLFFHNRRSTDDDNDDDSKNLINLERIVVDDMKLATELGGTNPKNYQIWYHRRALLEEIINRMMESNKETQPIREKEDMVATAAATPTTRK